MVVKKQKFEVTHDYFLDEYHRFREIMCSTAYTQDQKFDAYGGLLRVYFLCVDDEDSGLRETVIEMLQVEFPMRMGLELTMKLEKLFEEMKNANANN